jgi:hypothetical protein
MEVGNMVVLLVPSFKNIFVTGVEIMFRLITYDEGNIRLCVMKLEIRCAVLNV